MAGTIRFGASVSVSGRYALQGRQAIAGLRAWVEAVNAGGGLKVHGNGARAPVRLVHYDDASSPARAAANAERLLDADAVEVLIGPYASDLTRAVLPVAGRRGSLAFGDAPAQPISGLFDQADATQVKRLAPDDFELAGHQTDKLIWGEVRGQSGVRRQRNVRPVPDRPVLLLEPFERPMAIALRFGTHRVLTFHRRRR